MYAYVVNDEIKKGPVRLPSAWTDPRTLIKHDLTLLDQPTLLELGWYPIQTMGNAIEPFEYYESITYTVEPERVVETRLVRSYDLETTIWIKHDQINTLRDEYTNGGFVWNDIPWDTTETSRENVTGVTSAIANGVPLPEGFVWTDANNVQQPMTAADMIAMGTALMGHVNRMYQVSWLHKNTVSEMIDIEEIIQYDHTILWE